MFLARSGGPQRDAGSDQPAALLGNGDPHLLEHLGQCVADLNGRQWLDALLCAPGLVPLVDSAQLDAIVARVQAIRRSGQRAAWRFVAAAWARSRNWSWASCPPFVSLSSSDLLSIDQLHSHLRRLSGTLSADGLQVDDLGTAALLA